MPYILSGYISHNIVQLGFDTKIERYIIFTENLLQQLHTLYSMPWMPPIPFLFISLFFA